MLNADYGQALAMNLTDLNAQNDMVLSNTTNLCSRDIAEFAGYIQIIGRGQRTGKMLSQVQAYRAMKLMLKGKVYPEQEGAFLMLLRVREESVDEIAGFTQACRETVVSEFKDLNVDLDVSAYAGKRRQLPFYLLALAVLAQQGVSIMLHSTAEPQSQRLYAQHALTQLGVVTCSSASDAKQQLASSHFCHVDLKQLHPKLSRIIQLRELFGLRSCANTLARLLNPSCASYSLQGVHHKHVDDRHMYVSQRLSDQNTLCFRGEGGEPEYNASADTQLCINRGTETKSFGFDSSIRWTLKDKSLDIEVMKKLFNGTVTHTYGENAVVGTLAIILILMKDSTPSKAKEAAKAMWNGRTKEKLFR
jgi:anthranilate phosphoribosyltransferase